jgi:mono/diheme cytochrome c family protein
MHSSHVAAIAFCMCALACQRTNVPLPAVAQNVGVDTAGLVARGEYIVRNVVGCVECHGSTEHPDEEGALSGGMEFKDWRIGTARAANLTPDSATGLGAWSEPEIVRALRNGVARDGRLLTPAMPYEWFNQMSDRDALAVARYLKSRPPVRNEVMQSPSIWFKLGKLFFIGPKRGTLMSAPPRAPTPEYGAYLSQHVALCAHCHTPHTGIRSAANRRRLFAGEARPPKGFPPNAANLTPDSATGIGKWSEADFLATMPTGVRPAGDTLHAFIPWRPRRRMSDDDLRAMYRFLRTVPPTHNEIIERR